MIKLIKRLFEDYSGNSNDFFEINDTLINVLEYHRIDMILADKPISYCENIEIYNCLSNKRELISKNNENYIAAVNEINTVFKKNCIDFILLKGCALMIKYYKEKFHRSFNDIDFLIDVKDIGKVEEILNQIGYIQGEVVDGNIIQAKRKDILFQRLNTHEIYHMVKFDNSGFEINIDINFKFAWVEFGKSGDSLIKFADTYENIENLPFNNTSIPILNSEYQFVHLCCHLYNEAVYFTLDKQYISGDDPKELSLFRLLDIFLVTQHGLDIKKIYDVSKRADCVCKIEFVLSLLKTIVGLFYVDKFSKYFNINNIFSNYYFSVKGKKIEWPIDLCTRLFNVESKNRALEILVQKGLL